MVGARQKHSSARVAKGSDEAGDGLEEFYTGPIVVSGIAGRFPKSENMKVLKENLLAGMDLMSENNRWPSKMLPKKMGFLDCLDQFDQTFFNYVPRQADLTDPQIRLMIEVAFEALIDAGEY